MASTQEALQQADSQVRPELNQVRQQIDQIEQQTQFQMQTAGYPSSGQSSSTSQFQTFAEVTALKERAETFAQWIRERADRLIQQTYQQQQMGPQFNGSSPQSSTQVLAALRQVLSTQERIWQHVQQVVSQTSSSK